MKKLIAMTILGLLSMHSFAQCDNYQYYMQEVVDNADDAEEYAEETYDNARKAYYADNLKDAQYYAKKAMNTAKDAQDEADDAEDEGDNGLSSCD